MIDITTMEANNIFDVLEFLNKEDYDITRYQFWNTVNDGDEPYILGNFNNNYMMKLPKGRYLFIWPKESTNHAKELKNILAPVADLMDRNNERVLIYNIPKVVES